MVIESRTGFNSVGERLMTFNPLSGGSRRDGIGLGELVWAPLSVSRPLLDCTSMMRDAVSPNPQSQYCGGRRRVLRPTNRLPTGGRRWPRSRRTRTPYGQCHTRLGSAAGMSGCVYARSHWKRCRTTVEHSAAGHRASDSWPRGHRNLNRRGCSRLDLQDLRLAYKLPNVHTTPHL